MTKKELREAIGKRLLELRQAKNLTQAEAAARLRVCASQLSEMENGKRGISIFVMMRAEEQLGRIWRNWE